MKITRLFFLSVLLLLVMQSVAQTQQELLLRAYKERSPKTLRLFIDRWSVQPADTGGVKNLQEPIRSIQELYAAYYGNPRGVFEGDSFAMLQPAFVVLSDKIDYAVIDSINLLDREDRNDFLGYEQMQRLRRQADPVRKTIQPFIPHLPGTDIRYLLMDSTYERMIEDFLRGASDKEQDRGHDPDKVHFLQTYLPMQKRHWGEYWNYMSYPEVESIVLDKKLEQAVIWFRTSSAYGVAYMMKEEGLWRQIGSRILISQ